MKVSKILLGQVIKNGGIEYLGRYYAVYRGIVVDNKDPDDKCRLLLKIPALFGDRWYPNWAVPKGQRGNYKSGTKYLLPKSGEVVWVSFINGDPRFPVWEFHGWATGEIPEELSGVDIAGTVTPCGNKVVIDDRNSNLDIEIINTKDKDKKLNITIRDGNDISIESNGKYKVVSSTMELTNGKELQPAVLGETLRDLLSDFISTMTSALVVTTDGEVPLSPTTISQLNQLSERVENILSNYLKIS